MLNSRILLYCIAFCELASGVCYSLPDLSSNFQANDVIWPSNDYDVLKRDQNWTTGAVWSFESDITGSNVILSMPDGGFQLKSPASSNKHEVIIDDTISNPDGIIHLQSSDDPVLELTNNMFCFPPRLHSNSDSKNEKSYDDLMIGSLVGLGLIGVCFSILYIYCNRTHQSRIHGESNDRNLLDEYVRVQSEKFDVEPLVLDVSSQLSSVTTVTGNTEDISISVPYANSRVASPLSNGGGFIFTPCDDPSSTISTFPDIPGSPLSPMTPSQAHFSGLTSQGHFPVTPSYAYSPPANSIGNLSFDKSKINNRSGDPGKAARMDSPRPNWKSRFPGTASPDRLIVIPELHESSETSVSSTMKPEGSTRSSPARPKRTPGSPPPVGFE